MRNIISLALGESTLSIYRRELKRMEQECGNSCPDWYSEIYEDKLEEYTDEDGVLDFEGFEIDMTRYADEYIEFELKYNSNC